VIGIGPGDEAHMTARAREVLGESSVVIGYKTYLDFVRDIVPHAEIFSSGMTQEIARCTSAIQLAQEGRRVALISGGDAGIYGMAGLVFELMNKMYGDFSDIDIEVVPGVSSIQAAAAALGAPLMHDFVVISLSDILTPWDLIEKRLKNGAEGDVVIALLNPKSKKRTEQIVKAREIIMECRGTDVPVGIVKNAGRKTEEVFITNLEKMLELDIDMTTIVIIGNSQTFIHNLRMVTPRIGLNKK